MKKEQTADPLVSHIDSTVLPGTDFFLFANGKWFKQHPIPASEPSKGIFQLIQDSINAQIKNICESSAALKDASKGSAKQKIGDFFFTGMDSVSLNKKGISDLKPEFDKIDGIKDINGIIKEASYIHTIAGSPIFGFGVGQDAATAKKSADQLMKLESSLAKAVGLLKLVPVMVTNVPTGPLAGVKEVMVGEDEIVGASHRAFFASPVFRSNDINVIKKTNLIYLLFETI